MGQGGCSGGLDWSARGGWFRCDVELRLVSTICAPVPMSADRLHFVNVCAVHCLRASDCSISVMFSWLMRVSATWAASSWISCIIVVSRVAASIISLAWTSFDGQGHRRTSLVRSLFHNGTLSSFGPWVLFAAPRVAPVPSMTAG